MPLPVLVMPPPFQSGVETSRSAVGSLPRATLKVIACPPEFTFTFHPAAPLMTFWAPPVVAITTLEFMTTFGS